MADLALGDAAPDFDLPDLDGARVRLSEAMGSNGAVVAFICNHCPYVKRVITELVADAATLKAQGVALFAVMSNDYAAYPADAPARMAEFAQAHGFGFPYLLDEDQSVARAYGAVCTPEFFGLGPDRRLRYRGRLDDRGGAPSAVGTRTPELVNAMTLVAETGAGPAEQHAALGCSIKWR